MAEAVGFERMAWGNKCPVDLFFACGRISAIPNAVRRTVDGMANDIEKV